MAYTLPKSNILHWGVKRDGEIEKMKRERQTKRDFENRDSVCEKGREFELEIIKEKEREKEKGRFVDRQVDRQIYRQIDREREIDRQREKVKA